MSKYVVNNMQAQNNPSEEKKLSELFCHSPFYRSDSSFLVMYGMHWTLKPFRVLNLFSVLLPWL